MKYNSLLAVISTLFGVMGAVITFIYNTLGTELIILGLTAVVSSLLGLLGIYLFEKDYKIAIVQYIICGIGILVSTGLLGLLAFLLYMITALVTFMEKDKSVNYFHTPLVDSHYYGDESEIRKKYDNFPRNQQNSVVYWIIPAVSVIIILMVAVIGSVAISQDFQSKAEQIELTNITSDIKGENGHYNGSVQATLTSAGELGNLKVRGCWYSSEGVQIDESYDTNIYSKIEANQHYLINIPYDKMNIKPSRVEIQVYVHDNDLLYSKNVTFN